MGNKNDVTPAETNDSTPTTESTVPDAVNAAFDDVFSNLSADDLAEIGEAGGADEQTETPPMSADQQARAKNRRNLAAKEQQDELEEEGLVSADDPDGTGTAAKSDEEKPGEQADDAAKKAAAAAAQEADKVDPALRLAANEMGWTDEKINRLYKADPELAMETLNTLADTYTNLSRQYLTIPGSQQAAGTQQNATEQPAQQQAPTSQLDKFYSQIEAFAETNGEDLANFAKALKKELIEPVREILASNKAKQEELYATEARTTVTALGDKFPQFYGGVEGKALTDVEKNNRAYLGQVADQLRAGAKAQGRDMSIKDAITRAHLVVTAQYRDQIVRKQISGQVQTRQQQITAKPTQRRDPKLTNGRSVANATEAVARKMAELGIEDSGE
jgi:hypothetical protein